jgi:hypothetical protein
MITNQLSARQIAASDFFPHFFETNGWGYGLSVTVRPDAMSQTPWRYGWMGGFGTTWASHSRGPVICIAMTQSTDFLFNGAHDEFLRAVFRGATA